ncbi:MAG TPA: pseudouridine synthase [Mycobacteriales bacterium]|jgi:23S rRNA pseudouridine2605 synthase|nr:pseudouridine synthase [Mycobacteriales bacterium]
MNDPAHPDTSGQRGERLQKVMAAAGVGSRRRCEQLIEQGRVSVDGEVIRRQGVRIDPESADLRVDGDRVVSATGRLYLALNKPAGMVSTMDDELGRQSLADVRIMRGARLFHVGRLDADTEGLLLLTNDGDLAHRLMHPSFEVSKTYLAEVNGPVSGVTRRQLREGVLLDDGMASVDAVRVVDSAPGRALLEIRLHEGRHHIVRRLLAHVGHPVRRLVRTHVGPIMLGDLRSGRTRPLTSAEIAALYRLVDLST